MEEIRESSAAAAAPQATADIITETAAPFSAPADNAGGVRVRYNHEDRLLSGEETALYAQKGLKFDALAGQLGEDTLRRLPGLAARLRELDSTGQRTLPELIDALADAAGRQRLAALTAECGGNEKAAQRLLELERAQHREKPASGNPDAAQTAAPSYELEERLADGFLALRQAVPEITDFREVPAAAVELAAAGGISLLDAYLRVQHDERRRAAEARKAAEAAAAASAGRQSDGTGETADPVLEAVLRGIWER